MNTAMDKVKVASVEEYQGQVRKKRAFHQVQSCLLQSAGTENHHNLDCAK
jgi:hypothetical protein